MKAENLRQEFATRAVNLREAFTDNSLSSFVEGASKELEAKQVILDAMFKLFDERGPGSSLIYKNKHRQYGFVLPDASQEGAFRYQLFDAKGFLVTQRSTVLTKQSLSFAIMAIASWHLMTRLTSYLKPETGSSELSILPCGQL